MKVLIVEHFLPNNNYTLEFAKALKDRVDLTMFCRSSVKEELPGIRWRRVFYADNKKPPMSLLDYGNSLRLLRREILDHDYDVVHVETFKAAKYEIPLYLRLRPRIRKLVFTVHNILPHEADRGDRELLQRFYDACDLLIVHNEQSRQVLQERFVVPDEKIRVIAHGTYEVPAAAPHVAHDKCTMLMFGTMRKYKGIDIFLQAIAKLPASARAQMHFIVAGRQYQNLDSTDYAEMVHLLQIDDCVTLIQRRIDDSELPELYGQTDVCVFPYREIFGSGALLMAYSYEKPVIVSDIPSFLEETDNGKTGLLFPSEDAEALSRQLLHFCGMTAAEREEFVREIRRLTAEKYSWDISAQKTAEAYRELLDRNH